MTTNILAELTGMRCRCGDKKRKGETFCWRCYYMLPKHLRSPLYRGVGEGYNEAYTAAVAFLRNAGKIT